MVDALMIIINLVVKSMFSCFLQLVQRSACFFEYACMHQNILKYVLYKKCFAPKSL